MRVPYGKDREFFKYSLFLVFCNRITTSTAAAGALLVRYSKSLSEFINLLHYNASKTSLVSKSFVLQVNKKALDPVAPLYKYCAVSVSNILTTTCQYEVTRPLLLFSYINL